MSMTPEAEEYRTARAASPMPAGQDAPRAGTSTGTVRTATGAASRPGRDGRRLLATHRDRLLSVLSPLALLLLWELLV
ncbi:MAG TPA: hypothetical protein VIK92_07300, partial [Thermaerobacter sp.]